MTGFNDYSPSIFSGRNGKAFDCNLFVEILKIAANAQNRVKERVIPLDLEEKLGITDGKIEDMPMQIRKAEITSLVENINDEYTPQSYPIKEIGEPVRNALVSYLFLLTGEKISLSPSIEKSWLRRLLHPEYVGEYTHKGDVRILREFKLFNEFYVAHELSHRAGIMTEREAQVFSYLALQYSPDKILQQSAKCERLYGNIRAKAYEEENLSFPARHQYMREFIQELELRPEVKGSFHKRNVKLRGGALKRLRKLDDQLKKDGQEGLTAYYLGFTNFLYTAQIGI